MVHPFSGAWTRLWPPSNVLVRDSHARIDCLGGLAFGAVYPWAFSPLFVGCATLGIAGFVRHRGTRRTERALAVALVCLIAAIGVQLVPLPISVLQQVSPATDGFLRGYEVGYAASAASHPLSIDAGATTLALAVTIALSIFLLGTIRAFDRDDGQHIVRGIIAVAVILALVGIVQKALWNGRIYGLWMPMEEAQSFGPFVNRNHFAGWMLMAMPLALGYLCARIVRRMRHVKPDLRSRVLWLSSAEASETLLIAFAVLLMALSLTLSMSRSGTLGLLAAVVISGLFVIRRRQTSTSRRAMVTAYLLLVLLVAFGWTGAERLAARFNEDDAMTFGSRFGIWANTWRVAGEFPLAGTGLNTYGTSMLLYQTAIPEKHLAQAHNDYLQLLAEGGLLVGIPASVLIIVIARTIYRRFQEIPDGGTDYWIRVGAVTGILAIALQEVGEFSLQVPGNAVLFVLLLAIALRPVDSPSAHQRTHRR